MLLSARNLAVPRCFGSVLDYQPVGQGRFRQLGVYSEVSRRMPRSEKNVPKCVQTPSSMGANIPPLASDQTRTTSCSPRDLTPYRTGRERPQRYEMIMIKMIKTRIPIAMGTTPPRMPFASSLFAPVPCVLWSKQKAQAPILTHKDSPATSRRNWASRHTTCEHLRSQTSNYVAS